MKVLVLSRYGRLGASSRLRIIQFMPILRIHQMHCTHQPLFEDAALQQRYLRGGYTLLALIRSYSKRLISLLRRRRFDLIWIEKEALPWLPAWLELLLLNGVPYAMDFDDAIFHNYDLHRWKWIRRFYGTRIDQLMAGASLVIAGNSYLATRAIEAGAKRVALVPTVIDLQRYPPHLGVRVERQFSRLVWVGSPSTVQYLEALREPLQALSFRYRLKLRVIGGGHIEVPGVDVETVDWSEATEIACMQECDIGVMPLQDTPWELGKCGYKLIQYMACGLPVVASPVGANVGVVRHGENGFLAGGASEWIMYLERLLNDPALCIRMGEAGRRRVEEEFSLTVQGGRVAELLKQTVTR